MLHNTFHNCIVASKQLGPWPPPDDTPLSQIKCMNKLVFLTVKVHLEGLGILIDSGAYT